MTTQFNNGAPGAAMFNNGSGTPQGRTKVHGFPLPPEGRQYRPTYSRGRYALPDPETGKTERYTRVTTGAHTLDATEGLDIWKTGNVVLGLKEHPDLLDDIDMYADPVDARRQARRVANKAQDYAGANEAAELGTAIHAWTEAVERDGMGLKDVPDQFQPYVKAYLDTLDEWGVTTVPGMVERIVYHPASGWVGTLDRIYRMADGTRVIGDIKTSKTLQHGWLGFSVQFAAYADAAYMLSLDGSGWEPMPVVSSDYAVVAHVPSNQPGRCSLVTFDLAAGREYLGLAVAVRRARLEAGRRVQGKWVLPKPQGDLEAAVFACTSVEELARLWESHPGGWSPELVERALAHAASLGRK